MHSPKDWLSQLHASAHALGPADIYNQGDKLEELEKRVAVLLNKPASLFFPKGTIAQLCALKVCSEQRHNNNVAVHAMSHIAHDEFDAYQALMGLNGITIGRRECPFNMQELGAIETKLAALSVELPLRRAGFKLTP
jgi:threonine aldolase